MQPEQLERLVATLPDCCGSLLAEPLNEESIVNCLRDAASRQGHRVAARVNLWRCVDRASVNETPHAYGVLTAYRHPLQPDIDLLTEGPDLALSIHEVKLIRWSDNRPEPTAPDSRLYDGLGQALALTTFGADYCYLWHIWVHPMKTYRDAAERSLQFADRLEDGWVEFFAAYAGFVKGILNNFNLPVGYVVLLVIKDEITNEVQITPFPMLSSAPTKLSRSLTGDSIRQLMTKALTSLC